MKIVSRSEIGPDRWNNFCDAHEGAWWWWRDEWLSYQVARGARDLSFGIDDGDLVAICPLLLEERNGVRSFTMEGHPGPAPLFLNWQAVVLAQHKTETLIEAHAIKRQAYRSSPFVQPNGKWPSMWSDISWHTQLLDLTPSLTDLWRGVRKSYHALIHHIEQTHKIVVDEDGTLLEAFRQLHAEVAGRETRPKTTWDMMADWCRMGNGLHICAILGGVVVAAVYFEVYKRGAYYGHAAALNKNVTHALIWRAIQELKARGVTQLEMGWLDYPGEESRGFFKTGFGGRAVPIVAVERRF